VVTGFGGSVRGQTGIPAKVFVGKETNHMRINSKLGRQG